MQGRTHCLSGIVAGAALAPVVGLDHPAEVTLGALATGGWAIFPDLDHPSSLATRSLGPVTGRLSRVLRGTSARLYQATKGPRDEDWTGTHRHMTHCGLFALLLGVCLALVALVTPWAVAGVLAAGVALTHLAVGRGTGKLATLLPKGTRSMVRGWPLLVGVAAAAWWAFDRGPSVDAWARELSTLSWHVALFATVGCVVHSLGDGLTHMGVPLLFPLPIAGETWYELRPPAALRFTTGSVVESWLVTPLLLGGLLWLCWGYGLNDIAATLVNTGQQWQAQ